MLLYCSVGCNPFAHLSVRSHAIPCVQVPVEEQEFDDQGQTYGTRLRKIHVIGPQSTQQTIESEVQLADREAEQDVVTKLAQNYAKCLQIMLQVWKVWS